MNSKTKSRSSLRRLKAPALVSSPVDTCREPAFETQELGDAMRLTVYVPGVAANGVEIEGRGADLTITARKAHFVRTNFAALHLEGVQHDYGLRLRLGTGFDFEAMAAEITGGILTINVPKRAGVASRARERLAHAA